ncbi:hypothetical protein J3F84DRAFT_356199 [Trichoderma pleuroticola]
MPSTIWACVDALLAPGSSHFSSPLLSSLSTLQFKLDSVCFSSAKAQIAVERTEKKKVLAAWESHLVHVACEDSSLTSSHILSVYLSRACTAPFERPRTDQPTDLHPSCLAPSASGRHSLRLGTKSRQSRAARQQYQIQAAPLFLGDAHYPSIRPSLPKLLAARLAYPDHKYIDLEPQPVTSDILVVSPVRARVRTACRVSLQRPPRQSFHGVGGTLLEPSNTSRNRASSVFVALFFRVFGDVFDLHPDLAP